MKGLSCDSALDACKVGNEYQCLLGANLQWVSVPSREVRLSSEDEIFLRGM